MLEPEQTTNHQPIWFLARLFRLFPLCSSPFISACTRNLSIYHSFRAPGSLFARAQRVVRESINPDRNNQSINPEPNPAAPVLASVGLLCFALSHRWFSGSGLPFKARLLPLAAQSILTLLDWH
jgi:hypothetical protein